MSDNNTANAPSSKGSSMEKKYKFKELKIYGSDEWMAGSTKKYRRVFDRAETSYLWAELTFFNKLFDEEDWETKFNLKCFEVTGAENGERKEICNLSDTRTVSMDDNIIAIHKGWGTPTPGSFWTKGDYIWEAWLDGQLIGSQTVYVNEVGKVTPELNPYFSINHVKLYSAGEQGWKGENKKYLKKFNKEQTPFVWVELNFKVKQNTSFWYEVFFNFYDDAGQPKGTSIRMYKMDEGKLAWNYNIESAWGAAVPGSWKDDKYTVEIVFMDTLLAVVPFETGEAEEEGLVEVLSGKIGAGEILTPETEVKPEETIEQLLAKMDELIGLESVKKNIKDHINYLNFLKIRKEKGFDDVAPVGLHSVFTGNPGTGKTTVVNMLGKIYQRMGILSKGHVKEVDRSDLVGEYIGQSAPKVKKAINDARGGILFIDEAYSLARPGLDSKDFGHEVIEILIKEMSDGKGDIAIMCAGYPKEMQDFVDANPGLRSRFSHYFNFEDYLPEELLRIAEAACAKQSVSLTPEGKNVLTDKLIDAYRSRDKSFGNARFANGVIVEAKMNLGIRLMNDPKLAEMTKEEMSVIDTPDIQKVFAAQGGKQLHLDVDEKLLKDALAELNSLTGMENIKTDLNELVKLVRFYKETGKDVLNKFSLHSVFSGNPGTGKTTMARIIAKVYKGLGLLERGHVVEVDREGLVAAYVGQTAIKTAEKVQLAMGGVLFIDEAYALTDTGSGNDFGHESVEIILKRMEDERGKFAVIVAGYPDKMSSFMESNPGLRSRFDHTYQFKDYSPDEMYVIALSLFRKEQVTPDAGAEAHLKGYFNQLYSNRDKHFGNARTVRQVVGESVKNQNLRLASMESGQRTREMLGTLLLEDVQNFVFDKDHNGGRVSIGFKTP